MPIRNLTDTSVKALKPTGAQVDYWSSDLPGFGVRVSPAGRKAFVLRYRVNGGRQRRLTLGVYPRISLADARTKARRALGDVAHERDPAQTRQDARVGETFGELAALYMEKHAMVQKRSWREDRRIIDNELLPKWKHVKAKDLRRADVRNLVEEIGERPAPIMANRVLATIRKIYNFGLARDIVEFNPCSQIDRPGQERQRDRVLPEGEIRQIWLTLEGKSPEMAAFYRLRLITAPRGGEVINMRWADLDLDGRWWTIPAEHSKNKLPHRVPLSKLALAIVKPLKDAKPHGAVYALSGARGKRQRAEAAKRLNLSDFRGHDLRRTAASHMASAGIPRLVIGKVLNHVERGVTATYDRHSYDAEKRAALDAWARKLTAILKGSRKGANVLAFAR